jgi:hypothetical protein
MRTPRSTFGAADAFPYHRRSLLSCSGRRRAPRYAHEHVMSTTAKPQVIVRYRSVSLRAHYNTSEKNREDPANSLSVSRDFTSRLHFAR